MMISKLECIIMKENRELIYIGSSKTTEYVLPWTILGNKCDTLRSQYLKYCDTKGSRKKLSFRAWKSRQRKRLDQKEPRNV